MGPIDTVIASFFFRTISCSPFSPQSHPHHRHFSEDIGGHWDKQCAADHNVITLFFPTTCHLTTVSELFAATGALFLAVQRRWLQVKLTFFCDDCLTNLRLH